MDSAHVSKVRFRTFMQVVKQRTAMPTRSGIINYLRRCFVSSSAGGSDKVFLLLPWRFAMFTLTYRTHFKLEASSVTHNNAQKKKCPNLCERFQANSILTYTAGSEVIKT